MPKAEDSKRQKIRAYFVGDSPSKPSKGLFGNAEKHEREMKRYERELAMREVRKEKYNISERDVRKRPVGVQVDNWLVDDIVNTVDYALKRLNITGSSLVREDPLIVYGPIVWSTLTIPAHDITVIKDPGDNLLRFSAWQLGIFFLTEYEICAFQADFNFLRGTPVNERTVRFLYRNIVSVTTQNVSVQDVSTGAEVVDERVVDVVRVFRLAVPNDEIKVSVGSPRLRDIYNAEAKLDNYEHVVNAINAMVRDRGNT